MLATIVKSIVTDIRVLPGQIGGSQVRFRFRLKTVVSDNGAWDAVNTFKPKVFYCTWSTEINDIPNPGDPPPSWMRDKIEGGNVPGEKAAIHPVQTMQQHQQTQLSFLNSNKAVARQYQLTLYLRMAPLTIATSTIQTWRGKIAVLCTGSLLQNIQLRCLVCL